LHHCIQAKLCATALQSARATGGASK
jgi:hypothetical protein